MNDLEHYYYNNKDGVIIHKWLHYFDIYDRHFNRFRGKKINILEIGVYHGGSLKMWQNYFGDQASVYAIDINPTCKTLEDENVKIYIGSQSDREFLRELKSDIPVIDILIDDGGHTMEQQIITFEELYDHVSDNGVYLCEDTHTSYWKSYGGGYKKASSFIEYSKNLIDKLNAWHIKDNKKTIINRFNNWKRKNVNLPSVDKFTRSTQSIHYYDSVVVFEKQLRREPEHRKIGKKNPLVDDSKSF